MILFLKAQVKGHMRRLAGGRMALVRPYSRDDAPGQGTPDLFAPRGPRGPGEETHATHATHAPLRADDGEEEPGAPPCLFCGKPEHVAIHEMWDDHSFMLETCCEGLHEQIAADMEADPEWATELMRRLEAAPLAGRELRRTVNVDGQFLLDWKPEVGPIQRKDAQAFIGQWHRHNKPPPGDIFRAGVWNGGTLLGVAMIGRPVARRLDQRGDTLEVNRVCIRTDLPRELTWKAASTLYQHAADEAERRGYSRIITYTRRDEESGMSLRYARWKPDGESPGGPWHRPSRPRGDQAEAVPKLRWVKVLHPAEPRAVVTAR